MKKSNHIKYWLDSARHDMETARGMFQTKKYDWSLFIGHLVIEKVLKAFWVRDNSNNFPPRVHNLVKLAEQTRVILSEDQKLFLMDINDFNLEVRYPDYKLKFYKMCNKRFTAKYFKKIEELYLWLKKRI